MPPRTTRSFAAAVGFSRGCVAAYVDAAGATVTAAANEARFTHAAAVGHARLGLLIEGLGQNPAPDVAVTAAAAVPAAWLSPPCHRTILHHWFDAAGAERWDCHFTDDPLATWNGLLRERGIHAERHCLAFAPTDIADVSGDPPGLIRDGDSVTWVGRPGQAWAVVTDLLTSAALQHVLSAAAERIITGAFE
jgi:hypothetical protein